MTEPNLQIPFRDIRDVLGPHAGQPLSMESLSLLVRLERCADTLKLLDMPADLIFAPCGAAEPEMSAGEASVLCELALFDPVALVDTCLDQVGELNATLRALSFVDGPGVRTAAAAAQVELACGKTGVLMGLPIVFKDNIDVSDMPTGYGAASVFVTHPARDAAIVATLRRAGAVILGKANMFEFAYGAVHGDVGDTRNPLDPSRSAGGSSGGSAAAVAAGFAFGALGTDTGGSIRLPAAYCGIVGMKPSHGLLSMKGVYPLSPTLDHAGPMATCVRDVHLLMSVLAGFPPAGTAPRTGTIAVLDDYLHHPMIELGVRDSLNAACDRLISAGFQVRHIPAGALPKPVLTVETLLLVMSPEASIALEQIEAAHPQYLTAQTRAQITEGFAMPSVWNLRAHQFRHLLRAQMDMALCGANALLLPTVPTFPPKAAAEVGTDDDLSQMLCLAPFNLTGQPAITLPFKTGNHAFPAGLQLVGRIGEDAKLLNFAQGVENALR